MPSFIFVPSPSHPGHGGNISSRDFGATRSGAQTWALPPTVLCGLSVLICDMEVKVPCSQLFHEDYDTTLMADSEEELKSLDEGERAE